MTTDQVLIQHRYNLIRCHYSKVIIDCCYYTPLIPNSRSWMLLMQAYYLLCIKNWLFQQLG